ncbi:hypothetical protein DFH08DRAFT_628688, partial [Mycena albidolilacea]
ISRVPILKVDGANWLIFKTCFRHFTKSKNIWGHFDGSVSHPVPPAAQAELDQWDKDKNEAHNYLVQRLEDNTLLQADELDTVAEMWDKITNEFTVMSV